MVWQEGQSPTIVVEFLSPSTEQEDLGRFFNASDRISDGDSEIASSSSDQHPVNRPPSKVDVYEQYLRIPHYIVYSRYTQRLRYFKLVGSRYEEQPVKDSAPLIWLADLEIGLGLWDGYFEGLPGPWLRWCDAEGSWLLTDTEKAEQRAERLAQRLREMGVNPDDIS